MPSRPTIILRPIVRLPSFRICSSCLRPAVFSQLRPSRRALFHTTAPCPSDSPSNHYETLQLSSNAAPADIKRQFYTLSKQHHPDRNPDDPTASTRFVAISEAYHVLSVPEKRAKYDAQLNPSQRPGSAGYPQGSYSSAAFGSRPANGLNKKRSTFRGPPPSFYKSGGYGRHGAKRAEYAHHNPHPNGQEAPNESYGDFGGGFGPGQQKRGRQVPHFDDRKHKETHDNVYEHIWARRHKTERTVKVEKEYERGGMLPNFVMVSSVIALIGLTVKFFEDRNEANHNKRRGDVQ
ncbi:hypothetical protein GQ44DRAFT_700990 [Phaeosphaeriaceae sp. PMI808]|nr:hypothetical protein GQ44DRAFT_700990 [Phaeosphaeriaceae sp. PMI808]